MIRLIPIPLVALFALAVFASPIDAKSPFFKAEISGGDIATPIMIEQIIPGAWMDSYDRDAPASLMPNYTLRLFDSDAQGNVGSQWAEFTYYPGKDGDTAAIKTPDGHYLTVYRSLSQLIDANISAPVVAAAEPEDAGTSVWWFIPSAVGLGVILLGGGVAGNRMLKRRQTATG